MSECTALHYITLLLTLLLQCTALHHITSHYTTLHYAALHCTAHCNALHCTALHRCEEERRGEEKEPGLRKKNKNPTLRMWRKIVYMGAHLQK